MKDTIMDSIFLNWCSECSDVCVLFRIREKIWLSTYAILGFRQKQTDCCKTKIWWRKMQEERSTGACNRNPEDNDCQLSAIHTPCHSLSFPIVDACTQLAQLNWCLQEQYVPVNRCSIKEQSS